MCGVTHQPVSARWLDTLRGVRLSEAAARVRAWGYTPVGPYIYAHQAVDKATAIYLYADPSAFPDCKEPIIWFAELAAPR